MRKLLSVVLAVALVATSVVFMPSNAYAKGKVKSIKVSKTKMSLQVGKSDSAKVTIKVKKKASKAFKVKTSNAKQNIITVAAYLVYCLFWGALFVFSKYYIQFIGTILYLCRQSSARQCGHVLPVSDEFFA